MIVHHQIKLDCEKGFCLYACIHLMIEKGQIAQKHHIRAKIE